MHRPLLWSDLHHILQSPRHCRQSARRGALSPSTSIPRSVARKRRPSAPQLRRSQGSNYSFVRGFSFFPLAAFMHPRLSCHGFHQRYWGPLRGFLIFLLLSVILLSILEEAPRGSLKMEIDTLLNDELFFRQGKSVSNGMRLKSTVTGGSTTNFLADLLKNKIKYKGKDVSE